MNVIESISGKNGKISVLFVCLGNICRSPAAEGILRAIIEERGIADRFDIDSAGLYHGHSGELPDQRMRVHARRRGYELTHKARPVRVSDFDNFDFIIGMDRSNIEGLKAMAPTPDDEKKIIMATDLCRSHTWADHVPDPYYGVSQGFETVLDILEDVCETIADAKS